VRRSCGSLEVYQAPSPSNRPRVSIIVPRFNHSNVERNRLKRRLRECVRNSWLPSVAPLESAPEMVIRARRGAYEQRYADLCESVQRCVEERP
jgi:ribonuclease P protein component